MSTDTPQSGWRGVDGNTMVSAEMLRTAVNEEQQRTDALLGKFRDDLDAVIEENERLQDENEELRGELEAVKAELAEERNGGGVGKTKIAKRLAVRSLFAQADSQSQADLTGVSVDAPKMRDMAEGQNTRLSHKTIYDAWNALEDEWSALTVKQGSGDKYGKNKRLEADIDALPSKLRNHYE